MFIPGKAYDEGTGAVACWGILPKFYGLRQIGSSHWSDSIYKEGIWSD